MDVVFLAAFSEDIVFPTKFIIYAGCLDSSV